MVNKDEYYNDDCSDFFLGLDMSGIWIQRHIIGNVFWFNVYKDL